MKKIILGLLLGFVASLSVFAGHNSYIRITHPAVYDYDGYEYWDNEIYIYNSSKPNLENHYKIKGEVSSDCISIRVIWGKSEDSVRSYLNNHGRKAPGEKIDDFVLKKYVPGSHVFEYNANGKLENLDWGTNYYKVIAKYKDGSFKSASTYLYVYQGGAAEKGKPVIYLYPEKTQEVKVSVKPKGGVTESIPAYEKGWKVKATPEGKIFDLKTNEEYPYLFWESKDRNTQIDMSKGFCIPVVELNMFFKEKLSKLGLNEKEIADFNEFWIPSIEKEGKPYVFITFYDQARIDKEAPLKITPKPDSVIRVYFDHKVLDAPINVEGQELTANERKGFAVVEWGGRLYK